MSTGEANLRKSVELVMSCADDERRPRLPPELEALHARALQEALRRQILRDGFKTSLQQQALPTRCEETRQ